jgi:hypothetical protein
VFLFNPCKPCCKPPTPSCFANPSNCVLLNVYPDGTDANSPYRIPQNPLALTHYEDVDIASFPWPDACPFVFDCGPTPPFLQVIPVGTAVTGIAYHLKYVSYDAGSDTFIGDSTGLIPFQVLTGAGIPTGAYITAFDGISTLTISAATTAPGTNEDISARVPHLYPDGTTITVSPATCQCGLCLAVPSQWSVTTPPNWVVNDFECGDCASVLNDKTFTLNYYPAGAPLPPGPRYGGNPSPGCLWIATDLGAICHSSFYGSNLYVELRHTTDAWTLSFANESVGMALSVSIRDIHFDCLGTNTFSSFGSSEFGCAVNDNPYPGNGPLTVSPA